VPVNLTVAAVAMAAFTLQAASQTPPPPTKPPATSPATPRPAATQSAAAKPGSIVLTITNEKGDVLADANVTVRGSIDRGGSSGSDGTVTLQNMPAGTYRARINRDGYITLDKEVTVKAGTRGTAEAMLAAAPPPPPPLPPPPVETKPAAPAGAPGVATTASVVDLIDQMRKDPQPVVDRDLGCAYSALSKLIVAKTSIAAHQHADADEFVYVIYGDGTLTVGDKTQFITAGSFAMVPRGVSHAVAKKSGTKEIALFIVQTGKPCGGS
jgi:quercetin dioxygenase-like cupin family protein